jgi:hypothetical protein
MGDTHKDMQPVKLASAAQVNCSFDQNWFITQKMTAWTTSVFCAGIPDSTDLRIRKILVMYLTAQEPETAIFWGHI